ncbi:MAG: hypothetical protein J6330_11485 [Clostridia bacterium]|nr:hypothetical protein [Clostridia bacterium]
MYYKTKENVNPQGKQRVYFTCHPDDFQKHFESISKEILSIFDCAIWYTEEEYSDFATELGQMALFVTPVTKKLLTEKCRTIDIDIPFAKKNHIPILPLMQESGLDGLYEERFGDLQYLEKNTRDNTALLW